jgi:uncharacterized repeat protein (TIGR03803 family)
MRNLSMMLLVAAMAVILPRNFVQAQTFTTLYTFTGSTEGGEPAGGLISDSQDDLYGTTEGTPQTPFGTVFEMSPLGGNWTLNTLYTFQDYGDGSYPVANLVFDTLGNLYGTTAQGGKGYGTVFELSPNGSGGWHKSEIYQFQGGTDGANPISSLVIDGAGNLYGTTLLGGLGLGTVFELTPVAGGWTETVLHRFGIFTGPEGGLVFDAKGNLYGTADGGGPSGCGAVFEMTRAPSGWNFMTLHAFKCGSDGASPAQATLVFDSLGRIYGTTASGGAFKDGVVYVLTRRSSGGWANRVIHNFKGADGSTPYVGVTLDTAGNVYGTTQGGGNLNCVGGCGVAYKLTATSSTSWTNSILHNFTGADGEYPSPLLLDGVGDLFGTTVEGGAGNVGTVFEITPN